MLVSKLSSKGQVTIPKEVRECLRVRAGDLIEYEVQGDVEVVRRIEPFDRAFHSVIISRKDFNRHGQTLIGMITSSSMRWPSDCSLQDLASAGLSTPCVVRMKLFTLDNRLIRKRIGKLGGEDQQRVAAALKSILSI